MQVQLKSALLSVYHKDGLAPLVEGLHRHGVQLFATGGTYDFIQEMGVPVVAVEEITGYPSILGGRVKTLHPAVFGGILSKRSDSQHQAEMQKHGLPEIDLVVVDLYPFEETVRAGGTEEAIIEKIDIGGISLIRAGAKNFRDVLIIPSQAEYEFLGTILNREQAITSIEERRALSQRAFEVSSRYDTLIARWMQQGNLETAPILTEPTLPAQPLRYGENPHQQAAFIGRLAEVFDQLHGKELSYNNLLDIDAAVGLIREFSDTTVAILKHNNACGLSSGPDLLSAWNRALQADPVSAFGGVIVCNRSVDAATAEAMDKLFFEVLIAPGFEPESLTVLKAKKNRILLKSKSFETPKRLFRSILNGVLTQEPDNRTEGLSDFKTVTKKTPETQESLDMLFANKIVKHTKSNAIVLVKDQQMLASGTGQTSRVDALNQAIAKAIHFGFSLDGAVMASDAFFPFPDCVEIAAGAGITAIVQPGGSVRDQDSVDACDRLGIGMVTTGIRHFKH
jgi:phosphoribosylaminoimidazolecarboxamide formyltransferase/IMP cyclohydrolase